jgi:hypothetical protein
MLALLMFLGMLPQSGIADTFRCGDKLVSESSSLQQILSLCGEPTRKEISESQPIIYSPNGTVQRAPVVRTEVWIYDRSNTPIQMKVVVVDGKVKSVERAQ